MSGKNDSELPELEYFVNKVINNLVNDDNNDPKTLLTKSNEDSIPNYHSSRPSEAGTLYSEQLTSPFRLGDKSIDDIVELGYRSLDSLAKSVYRHVHYLNADKRIASSKTLSKLIPKSERIISNALNRLQSRNLVRRERKDKITQYYIKAPNPIALAKFVKRVMKLPRV